MFQAEQANLEMQELRGINGKDPGQLYSPWGKAQHKGQSGQSKSGGIVQHSSSQECKHKLCSALPSELLRINRCLLIIAMERNKWLISQVQPDKWKLNLSLSSYNQQTYIIKTSKWWHSAKRFARYQKHSSLTFKELFSNRILAWQH